MWIRNLVATLFGSLCLVVATTFAQSGTTANEIPIERCDRLPVVTLRVAGGNRRFLLDTAATTILNMKSFTSGESKHVHVYSWSGSADTSAREVFLPEVELGMHKLRNLKIPAIDLSPIGKACGGQIDGILGVDLLDRMGMTIDFKRRVAAFASEVENSEDTASAFGEVERDLAICGQAFNQGDAKEMTECFDPEIVFYNSDGEFRGRQEVMRYLTERFFKSAPKLHYEIRVHEIRSFGDALWYSYDYWIETPDEHLAGHGMSMCRKDAGGRWRILNLNESTKGPATSTAAEPVH